MHNVIAVARLHAGDEDTNTVLLAGDETFAAFYRRTAPVQHFAFKGKTTVAAEEYWSKEEILAIYEDEGAAG